MNVSYFETNLLASDFVFAFQGTPWKDFIRIVELDDAIYFKARYDGCSIEPFRLFFSGVQFS